MAKFIIEMTELKEKMDEVDITRPWCWLHDRKTVQDFAAHLVSSTLCTVFACHEQAPATSCTMVIFSQFYDINFLSKKSTAGNQLH